MSKTVERYLTEAVLEDLGEKMVFVVGPRQVGKTVLARDCVGSRMRHAYFTWDREADRRTALAGRWPPDKRLIILDEFHKFRRWKSWLKGEWDALKDRFRFLLTGSGRLDLYRRGGDSLQGRYHIRTLHPFTLAEVLGLPPSRQVGEELRVRPSEAAEEALAALETFGGFPEPFLRQDLRLARRWRRERLERFFREDVRDLSMVQDLVTMQRLAELLPERGSAVVSVNALAEDLNIHFRTAANWLDILESLYHIFRLTPWMSRQAASVRKERKLYFWDWAVQTDPARRLENLVASHLLKFRDFLAEDQGYDVGLHFLRDPRGREVDFLVCVDRRPWFAVEVKLSETEPAGPLLWFRERLKIPFCYQVVARSGIDHVRSGVRVLGVARFLTALA